MEQLGSHWRDFHEIWYLKIFRKSVEKIQVPLKSNKIKGYFTWRPVYNFIISRSVLVLEWGVSSKSCSENQNTHFVFSNYISKIVPFMRQCGKILQSAAGHRLNGACAFHAGYLRLQIHPGCVILIVFHCNNGCTNAPQCYVIRTLPVLLPLRRRFYLDSFWKDPVKKGLIWLNIL
jgi:hypothetical protein